MFFFFPKNNYPSFFDQCLRKYIKDYCNDLGYCDVFELIQNVDKNLIKKRIKTFSSELNELYKRKYPKDENDLLQAQEIFIDKDFDEISEIEIFYILYWCFKLYLTQNQDKETNLIMNRIVDFINNNSDEIIYSYKETIIYDERKVNVFVIDSISNFLNILNELHQQKNLFYRGHSKVNYKLCPSIFRNQSLLKNEKHIYQELIISCPEEFKSYSHHIDFLVKMQHYGLPTRLLDITKNPLVALYFACCSNTDNLGEVVILSPQKNDIKYENSDSVAILSSLPLFTYDEQIRISADLKAGNIDSSDILRLIHEIKTEKPGFENRIDKKDIEKCYVVLPHKDNKRIMKQDGAFVICGINYKPEITINENLRLSQNGKYILLIIKDKKRITDELDLLSINKSTLFPEIDSVSEYIKYKYSHE